MTAEHGFCFEVVPSNLTEFFSVINNNLTYLSLPRKPKQVPQNAVIALPPSPAPVTLIQEVAQTTTTTATEAKVEEK